VLGVVILKKAIEPRLSKDKKKSPGSKNWGRANLPGPFFYTSIGAIFLVFSTSIIYFYCSLEK